MKKNLSTGQFFSSKKDARQNQISLTDESHSQSAMGEEEKKSDEVAALSWSKKLPCAKKSKGLFVTFEGGEGAGKTTLIDRLYEKLTSKGHTAIKTREPGGTSLGKEIRKLLLYQESSPVCSRSELLLYLADRAQHVQEVILPALNEGKVVLCDRYNDSTLAYQGAARSLNIDLIKDLCNAATEGLLPDLTLYLDLDPKVGLSRAQQKDAHDRLEKESLEFHTKVRNAFLSLAEKEPDRFHIIDASQDVDVVFSKALSEIEAVSCLK